VLIVNGQNKQAKGHVRGQAILIYIHFCEDSVDAILAMLRVFYFSRFIFSREGEGLILARTTRDI
jgi:hypothetical protein